MTRLHVGRSRPGLHSKRRPFGSGFSPDLKPMMEGAETRSFDLAGESPAAIAAFVAFVKEEHKRRARSSRLRVSHPRIESALSDHASLRCMRWRWRSFLVWLMLAAVPLQGWAAGAMGLHRAISMVGSAGSASTTSEASSRGVSDHAGHTHHADHADHASPSDHACCADGHERHAAPTDEAHHHGECGPVCLCCIIAGPPTSARPSALRGWHAVWASPAPNGHSSVIGAAPEKPPKA